MATGSRSVNAARGEHEPLLQHAGSAGANGDKFDLYEANARASQAVGIFNLANAAIGAGVLAFPYAFALMGWVAGLCVAMFVMVVMMRTQYILAKATQITRSTGYHEVMGRSFGGQWGLIGALVLSLYLMGAMIAFMKVVGDQVKPVAEKLFGDDSFAAQPYFTISVFSALLILPLNLLPRVDILGPSSFLAVISCAYVAIFVITEGISSWSEHDAERVQQIELHPSFFAGVPLCTFAFTCHPLVPSVFSAIKGHDLKKFVVVIVLSYLICAGMYAPTGIFGYLRFGDKTQGDVLLNFSVDSIAADIGRIAMALTVIMAYPINHLPVRAALAKTFFPKHDLQPFDRVYLGITFAIFAFTLTLAIVVPGLSTVFGMFGATLGVTLVFIFPALLNVKHADAGSRTSAIIESVFIVIVGLTVGIAGGTMTIVGAIDPKSVSA